MTVGELARFFNAEFLPADGAAGRSTWRWCRAAAGGATCSPPTPDVPWVLPSPNMPTPDTALVYPGTCMFEGALDLRGPRHHPPVRADRRPGAIRLPLGRPAQRPGPARRASSGRRTSPTPTGQTSSLNKTCAGVEVKVTDRPAFDPIRTARGDAGRGAQVAGVRRGGFD